MQIKNKNIFITILSVLLCALTVLTSLWATPIQTFAEEPDSDVVWVDLQIGDIVANKRIRFRGGWDDTYSDSITVKFSNNAVLNFEKITPAFIYFEECPPDTLDTSIVGPQHILELEYIETIIPGNNPEPDEASGVYIYETIIPSSFSFPGLDFVVDFSTASVTQIILNDAPYGVKIEMLMNKDEAVAAGRYKVNNDHSLLGSILAMSSVVVIATICVFLVNTQKKAKRRRVYRGN